MTEDTPVRNLALNTQRRTCGRYLFSHGTLQQIAGNSWVRRISAPIRCISPTQRSSRTGPILLAVAGLHFSYKLSLKKDWTFETRDRKRCPWVLEFFRYGLLVRAFISIALCQILVTLTIHLAAARSFRAGVHD